MSVNLKYLPTLVLNSCYEPINVVSAQRAMTLLAKGVAVVQEPSKHFIHTAKLRFQLPSVIRLINYRYVPRRSRSVSRGQILLRDLYCCQYCLKRPSNDKLTLDHVLPKSRGGGMSWSNIVTSCIDCNNRKADRTPEEANMHLYRKPLPFSVNSKYRMLATGDNTVWDRYLFC